MVAIFPPAHVRPKLVITMPLKAIPSLNQTKSKVANWAVRAQQERAHKETGRIAALEAIQALPSCGWKPLEGSIRLDINLFYPNKRRRDILNADIKATLDGFTQAGVWLDDCLIDEARFYRWLDAGNPRVEFHVQDLGPAVDWDSLR
jgi:Holliday junction resolvase RusA-like endonuclease